MGCGCVCHWAPAWGRVACSPFQKTRGFYRFQKALLEVQVSEQAWCILLGPCQGPRHATFVPSPCRRACISQQTPGQQLRGWETACDTELPGAPNCRRAQWLRAVLESQQGRRKWEWKVEVRPWWGCPSPLAEGRCTRSMREPEKGSPGLCGEGSLM